MHISHTTILFFAFAVQIASADDKTSAPDFSHYQQTMYFQEIIQDQTNAAVQFGKITNILAISDFDYGSDRVVSQYFISENGKGRSWRNVPGWAIQPGKKIKQSLSEAELKNLKLAIKELPSQNSTPPLERLVIVSVKSGTNWVTRTYDRQSLPKAMLDICKIADLGIETKSQK
jgi:hypothetical protein